MLDPLLSLLLSLHSSNLSGTNTIEGSCFVRLKYCYMRVGVRVRRVGGDQRSRALAETRDSGRNPGRPAARCARAGPAAVSSLPASSTLS